MHAGISLRSYPRSDTNLSRPHPDTTLTVAPDSGMRTKSKTQINSLTFSNSLKLFLLYFTSLQNLSLPKLEGIQDFQNEFLLKLFYWFV